LDSLENKWLTLEMEQLAQEAAVEALVKLVLMQTLRLVEVQTVGMDYHHLSQARRHITQVAAVEQVITLVTLRAVKVVQALI
jgi:hypothetical protein